MRGDVWSLLGMLAMVILILIAAWWVTRWIGIYSMRSTPGKVRPTGGGERFCVVGRLGLGRSAQLLLVRLGDRCFLLGVSEEQITLLKELEPGQAEEWLSSAESTEAAPGFLEILKENLQKRK